MGVPLRIAEKLHKGTLKRPGRIRWKHRRTALHIEPKNTSGMFPISKIRQVHIRLAKAPARFDPRRHGRKLCVGIGFIRLGRDINIFVPKQTKRRRRAVRLCSAGMTRNAVRIENRLDIANKTKARVLKYACGRLKRRIWFRRPLRKRNTRRGRQIDHRVFFAFMAPNTGKELARLKG